jgi:hypothetical protein
LTGRRSPSGKDGWSEVQPFMSQSPPPSIRIARRESSID